MRILVLHTKYQLHGGEDTVVKQELELLRQNHTVEILYFQNHLGLKGALQFLGSVWNIFSAQKVKQKIKEFKPDVVHIHNWHFTMGPLVFRVVKQLLIPVVHTIHNYRLLCPSGILLHDNKLFTDSLNETFQWTAIRNKVYRSSMVLTFWLAFVVWFHRKIGTWEKIDVYICLTSFAVDVFQKSNFGISKEKFTVKPNFIIESEKLNISEREKHFLYVGRLSEEKGISILLAAFENLPFSIKIAGDGPLKDQVLEATQKFANISYLGMLSNNEVGKALQKTQALIAPSIWYEGMPMTILEAFSNATPVISSNLGAMISLISNGSNGFLFEPGNSVQLKETILKYSNLSSDEKKQMSMNAFDNYQTMYSPQMQHASFKNIYSSI